MGSLSSASVHSICGPERPELYLFWHPNLILFKRALAWKAWRAHRKTGTRARSRIPETRSEDEGAASVAVEGLRESWKKFAAWHYVVSQSPSENQKKLLVKVQPSCSRSNQHNRDASSMGWPLGISAAVEWRKPGPRTQANVWQKLKPEKWIKILWRCPEDHDDISSHVWYLTRSCSCFLNLFILLWLDYDCAVVVLSYNKKVLNCFDLTRTHG